MPNNSTFANLRISTSLSVTAALVLCMVVAGCGHRELKGNMTMLEVERTLGKPDRVETIPGSINGESEQPTVIRWHYARFPVMASGKDYGSAGHVNFVPKRFILQDQSVADSDKIAHQYGEGADAYRTFSYVGSFPTRKEYWHPLGPVEGLPVK
jgi:hypothetical protein